MNTDYETLHAKLYADAMIAHSFIESLVDQLRPDGTTGEQARGRDFAVKVPMAQRAVDELKRSEKLSQADFYACLKALKRLVAFIDPKPPAPPVLALTSAQVAELTPVLRECYRCLWSEHPGITGTAGRTGDTQ